MRWAAVACAYFISHMAYFIFHMPYEIRHMKYEILRMEAQGADVRRGAPLIYWTGGVETAESLKQAGIEQIAAPPDKAES